MILAFLATHWRWIAVLGVVLAVAGYVGVLKLELRHCNVSRETLEKQVSGLRQAVDAQNAAVAALKAQSDAKVAKASRGLSQARSAAQAAQNEAERLKEEARRKSPPVASGGCLAADGVKAVRAGLL